MLKCLFIINNSVLIVKAVRDITFDKQKVLNIVKITAECRCHLHLRPGPGQCCSAGRGGVTRADRQQPRMIVVEGRPGGGSSPV